MRSVFTGVLLMFASWTASPQTPQPVEVVTLTTTDQTGAAIPGAKLSVKSATGTAVGAAETDRSGRAQISLRREVYELSVSAPGFERVQRSLEVTGSSNQNVLVELPIGAERGYQGPCCFDGPNLPLLDDKPLTALIPATPFQGKLNLRPVTWKRFDKRR